MAFNPSLNEELSNLQQNASRIFSEIRSRYVSLRPSEIQKTACSDVWSALTDIGFFGFLVPQEYEGTSQGLLPTAIVMEAWGHILCTVSDPSLPAWEHPP